MLEEIILPLFNEGKQKTVLPENKRTDRKCITFFTPLCGETCIVVVYVCMVMGIRLKIFITLYFSNDDPDVRRVGNCKMSW